MRQLTDNEISILEDNSCWAEDWNRIWVDEDFRPNYFHRVMFYGDIELGLFDKNVEVSRGFMKHSGDRKSTRLNSSHANISYAVFCLKKKKNTNKNNK